MFAWPPWMRTKSGYFLAGSKPGGSTTKLCTDLPLSFVNENSCRGCQSSFDAASVVKLVRADCFLRAGSMRTISAGRIALPQLATRTVGFAASATSIEP
jgi:hypothetical protein